MVHTNYGVAGPHARTAWERDGGEGPDETNCEDEPTNGANAKANDDDAAAGHRSVAGGGRGASQPAAPGAAAARGRAAGGEAQAGEAPGPSDLQPSRPASLPGRVLLGYFGNICLLFF